MRGLRNAINYFRHFKGNKNLVGGAFVLGLVVFGGLGLYQHTQAQALTRDCDDNAIMTCGADTPEEFASKYDQNAQGDLPAIYGHYWIPRDLQVVEGQSFKDNTVRVNGRIVADNAQSIGRQQLNGEHPISIAGKTYYEGPNSTSFANDGLPTFVALDAQGNFKYAVIKGCGNPIYAHPVAPPPAPTPSYSCDMLTVDKITTTKQRFTAKATVANGAEIAGYKFDFGDGSVQESDAATVDHEYSQPGTYTAKVTVKVKVNGQIVEANGANCAKQVVIEQPPAVACESIQATIRNRTSVDVTINKTSVNATYKGATVDYGDGTSNQITGTTDSHTYAKESTYTIKATLQFDINGSVTSKTCQTTVTITPEECKPGIPAGDVRCNPCQIPGKENLPANSPQCVQPPVQELPTTGSTGGLVGAGFGLGSVIIAASFYITSRRDLITALLSR
jgi:PKD repeat protein